MNKGLGFLALLLVASLFATPALAMDTAAKQALLVDFETGAVLLDKNANEKMHPSSMSKLMTLYVLFQRLKEGRIKLPDTLPVSEKAWRMEGSRTFLRLGSEVPVETLIQGIIVQSGNDACVVVAEGLSGSEEAFAAELNRVAATLGMKDSHFVNASGWPDDNHLTTAHDLALLARHLIADFPEYYHYFSETEFTHNGITQPNRNLLLDNAGLGVDGLKTGHTEQAGYGIVLSAKEPASGRRLILVVNGLSSMDERAKEGDLLLRYGFREFTNRKIVAAGERIADAGVWFGVKDSVALVAPNDVSLTLPHAQKDAVKFAVAGEFPLKAPVAKGAPAGKLIVRVPGQPDQSIPLVTAEEVPGRGLFSSAWEKLRYWVLGPKQREWVTP